MQSVPGVCLYVPTAEWRLSLPSCPLPGIWLAGYPFPASSESAPHACSPSAAALLPWVHTLTLIPSSKYHGLSQSPVHLIPGAPIALPHLSAGLTGSSRRTASPVSGESWTFPTLPLALPTGWAPFFLCPSMLPSLPWTLVLNQPPCVGEVTSCAGGWAVPVLGSGSGVDQLGKGTGFRGASAIGELEVVCSGYPEGVELEREPGEG